MGLKFMDAGGGGRLSDAIAAIDYMVSMKVNHGVNIRVSNNSWGGGGFSPALHAAIDRARAAGIAFMAAAGNSRQDTDLFPSYPSSYEVANVVSVAAIDTNQSLASFSNFGAESVDIAAPGVGIFSTLPNGRYGYLSGTSMATPHVAGALALLFAAEPSTSLEQAIERLYETGRHTASLVVRCWSELGVSWTLGGSC
jgi:subtilisin family serine protease